MACSEISSLVRTPDRRSTRSQASRTEWPDHAGTRSRPAAILCGCVSLVLTIYVLVLIGDSHLLLGVCSNGGLGTAGGVHHSGPQVCSSQSPWEWVVPFGGVLGRRPVPSGSTSSCNGIGSARTTRPFRRSVNYQTVSTNRGLFTRAFDWLVSATGGDGAHKPSRLIA